jgi:hypothetical protein
MSMNEELHRDGEVVATRRPYWPVAVGLLGVIVVVLVSGFLLNKQFRSRVGVEQGNAVGIASPASAAVADIGADRTAASALPITSGAPAAASTAGVSDPLAQEVTSAYEHYWDVYSDAVLRLDASQLSQVSTGQELNEIQSEVDGLVKRNRAVRVVVEHHYFVFDATGTQAKVYDEVHNQSFTIDPATKQPPQGSQQTDIEKDTFFLSKADGVWKVTSSVRQRSSGQ